MNNNTNCYKSSIYNPMGNFLPFDNRDRPAVCNIPMNEHYNYLMPKNETFDNQFRLNFNPNAVTTSYPDISGFANYLFTNPARCRDTGYSCRINADQTKSLDRMSFNNPNEKQYQEINNNNNNNNNNIIYYLSGYTN
jgi:hypothetical protein